MSPQPLASVTFFIDHSLGGKLIAGRLRDLGAQIEILADHFLTETPDVEWLKAAGDKGWVVLSKDGRIRRDSVECAALKSAGVRTFFLTQQVLWSKHGTVRLNRANITATDRRYCLSCRLKALGNVPIIRKTRANPWVKHN